MSEVLLLPSARLVPPELQTEFGAIPSALIPLNNRPALHYIADACGAGRRLVVAVHDRADRVHEYLTQHPELHGTAVDVGRTPHIAATVLEALRRLPFRPSGLVVNFADTFVGDTLAAPDVVCYAEQPDVFRWTTFVPGPDGTIGQVVDKDHAKDGPGHRVFVGVFRMSDAERFAADLEAAAADPAGVDPFWTAIRAYYNRLPAAARTLQRVDDWRDFGHLDTYFATKQTFFLGARHFNSLVVDRRRGVVRKSSRDAAKLRDEIRWYLHIPRPLQYLAPRVFGYDLNGSEPWVELEFYGYPSLADLYLYAELSLGAWQQILTSLGQVFDDLHAVGGPDDEPRRAAALRAMYLTKTQDRLAPVLADPRFAGFCADSVTVNGQDVPGLRTVLDRLPAMVRDVGLDRAPRFTALHGDFCLSNVLYDRRHGVVRLIDPRGGFGGFDVYGDPRYDVAKLCHSLRGDYDFLTSGLFAGGWRGGEYAFRPYLEARHRATKGLFEAWVAARWPSWDLELRLIESLLFLTMVPLHADRFASQEAFLAQGLVRAGEVLAATGAPR